MVTIPEDDLQLLYSFATRWRIPATALVVPPVESDADNRRFRGREAAGRSSSMILNAITRLSVTRVIGYWKVVRATAGPASA